MVPNAKPVTSEHPRQTADGKRRWVTKSGKVALIVCGVYLTVLAAHLSDTILSFFVMLGAFSAFYLVLYVGLPLAFLIWASCLIHRIAIRKKRRRVIWTAVKSAIITFGVIGLVFGFLGMIPRTVDTFGLGYWCHVKVWADVDEIRVWGRKWGARMGKFQSIPKTLWPASLRCMPFTDGALSYRRDDATVTLFEGGGHFHWGMTVAPEGTPVPDGPGVLKLEGGAWVWHQTH